MRWFAGLRRRFLFATHREWDGGEVPLAVMPLEERRVLSVTAVSAGLDLVVDEGSPAALSQASYLDDQPGTANSPHEASVDWGDGQYGGVLADEPDGQGFAAVSAQHVYSDDGIFRPELTVRGNDQVTVTDNRATITVRNVAPTLTVVGNQSIAEGSLLSLTNLGTFTDPGFQTETFTYEIDWGDGTVYSGPATIDIAGSPGIPTAGSFDGSHTYADNGTYTVAVRVEDDDGGSDTGYFTVTVGNVDPTLTVVGNQSIAEGSLLSLTNLGTFTDPGFQTETFTYEIDWGDGTVDSGPATIDIAGSPGIPTAGSFDGSHTYADNGTYTVAVRVEDDDGGSDTGYFTVTVGNVDPTLTVVGNQSIAEGSLLSLTDLGTFTDHGFQAETFTYEIDWGDGTVDSGPATIDIAGSPGTPTAGSFDGSHTYADNGTYTVAVRVEDDDGGFDTGSFTVTVANVVPVVSGVTGDETVDEGASFTLADLGWAVADPGFDNGGNPSGATRETFTAQYTVDWGDGTPTETGAILDRVSGQPGVPTVARFEELPHTYADNGVYTVRITFGDDDSPPVTYELPLIVTNAAPTVVPVGQQSIDEGALLTVVDLATFTDPGFDNPRDPAGPSRETFGYEVDWGDGTPVDSGDATIDVAGAVGLATSGSFDGAHVYADNGLYTVTLTVTDDDGGVTLATTTVAVGNVAPTLAGFDDSEVNALGQVQVEGDFSDPGFDNPLNPLSPPDGSREAFSAVIDWADGTQDTILLGGTGPFSFTATHTYFAPPDPLNPAADIQIIVTVTDDDGGYDVAETFAEVPGEGIQFVYIDTTPKVPRLVFPRPTRLEAADLGNSGSSFFLASAEFDAGTPDTSAASENYVVLRTVLPDGSESNDYRLPENALDVLPEILRRLPDNRYRIYEIQSDGPERLVRDVFVRQKRVIDRTDAAEGIEERPPQSREIETDREAPKADESSDLPCERIWEHWEAEQSGHADSRRTSDGHDPTDGFAERFAAWYPAGSGTSSAPARKPR